MIDLMLYAVIGLSLCIAAMAWACIRAGSEYDAWVEEFNEKGFDTGLAPVLHGSEVVGYTLVTERRSNRR